jgi:sec-independent protein translocase protein TatB
VEFLGIGYQELLVIFVLLLVVVGPERLPAMAYQIGRAVREMQKYARAVRSEFSEEFSYIEEQVRTVRGEIDETRSTLREQQAKFESEMREATADMNQPLLPPETPSLALVHGNGASAEPAPAEGAFPADVAVGAPATNGAEEAPPAPPPAPPLVF